MLDRVGRAKAPSSFRWALGEGLSAVTPYNFFCFRRLGHLARLLRTQPAGWFARPWPDEVAAALAEAVRRLEALRGPDPARWAWGEVRPLVLHHPLTRVGRLRRALGRVFNVGPVPCGGDSETINQASVLPLTPLAAADNIASVRAVIDVGAWHNSRWCLPGGQSGNPLSPHYADQFPLWRRGEGVPIAFTVEEVQRAVVATLGLVPAAAGMGVR
jgi:penicillin amidase